MSTHRSKVYLSTCTSFSIFRMVSAYGVVTNMSSRTLLPLSLTLPPSPTLIFGQTLILALCFLYFASIQLNSVISPQEHSSCRFSPSTVITTPRPCANNIDLLCPCAPRRLTDCCLVDNEGHFEYGARYFGAPHHSFCYHVPGRF